MECALGFLFGYFIFIPIHRVVPELSTPERIAISVKWERIGASFSFKWERIGTSFALSRLNIRKL